MTLYKYRAKKGPKELIEDTIEANSEKEAIEIISQKGFVPVEIKEVVSSPLKTPVLLKPYLGSRVRAREITIFTRQLAVLLKSGVPILKALNILIEQSQNHTLCNILKQIHTAVKEGATFSSSLREYPEFFSSVYIALVRSGENSGELPEALLRIVEYRTKQEELWSRFRMALAYPILMAIVGGVTIVFMLVFVLPRLMHIFLDFGQRLPLPTRILISISQYLRNPWIWAILGLIILTLRRQARTAQGKLFFSRLKLALPIVGKLTLKAELGRFSRTLGILIHSGVPILRAMDISQEVVDNIIIKNKLKQSYQQLEAGGSFGVSLQQEKIFPLFVSNLIIVGEESGKLAEALEEVAGAYEQDMDEAMKIASTLFEPIMILGMGLVVGFIVMAMLLPIFEINLLVR